MRDEFRDTFLGIYALPSQSLLSLSLSAGLSSLRLPACSPASAPVPPKEERVPAHPQPLLPPPAADSGPPVLATIGSLLEDQALSSSSAPEVTEEEPRPPPCTHIANVDCPTCQEDMRVLANEVPMAHFVNSTLVCRISGDVMDSNNEPMAFPNGCVYSSKVAYLCLRS